MVRRPQLQRDGRFFDIVRRTVAQVLALECLRFLCRCIQLAIHDMSREESERKGGHPSVPKANLDASQG